MTALVVIPARIGSSRFPGKPLHVIAGKSLLQRVWEIAVASTSLEQVLIATDDDKIFVHANSFGGKAVMTDPKCRNGTERVQQALDVSGKKADVIINMQGDTPLTPPWFLRELISCMEQDPAATMATLAVRLSLDDYNAARARAMSAVPSGTYVTLDNNNNALYFSRFPIPFFREVGQGELPFYKHIGIYGYRPAALAQYLSLKPSALEEAEGLEQLRALQNGMKIKVAVVDAKGRTLKSVDTHEDAQAVEGIIRKEGEPLC